jgi:uncharacterized membrane protein required for colicin V production
MEKLFAIGNFYFDIVSVVIIALVFIAMIVGACRGFLKQLLSFGSVIITVAAAIFLCKALGELIYNMGVGNAIYNGVLNSSWITNKSELAVELNSTNFPSYEVEAMKGTILGYISIPSIIHGLFKGFLLLPETLGPTGETLGHYVSISVAHLATTAIGFVVIIILGAIIFGILRHIAKKIHRAPVVGGIDKVLGLVLGVAIVYVVVDAILFVVSLIIGDGSSAFATWVTQTLYLNDDSVNTISKFMFQHSLVSTIWNSVFNNIVALMS